MVSHKGAGNTVGSRASTPSEEAKVARAATKSFARFFLSQAHCADPNEEQRVLSAIESIGKLCQAADTGDCQGERICGIARAQRTAKCWHACIGIKKAKKYGDLTEEVKNLRRQNTAAKAAAAHQSAEQKRRQQLAQQEALNEAAATAAVQKDREDSFDEKLAAINKRSAKQKDRIDRRYETMI